MIVLDTNIIIDHLRQKEGKSKLVVFSELRTNEELAISVISIQELYEGKSTIDETEERLLKETIFSLEILPYTSDIAQKAGKIARDSKRPLELADAAIAATTIIYGGKLFTLNTSDFASIPHLELFRG